LEILDGDASADRVRRKAIGASADEMQVLMEFEGDGM
jgi:hypothetical protein